MSPVTVFECQPDWLTCSAWDPVRATHLLKWAIRELEGEADAGNKDRPFRLMGYSGHRCGRLAYGVGERGTIVQVSGDPADRAIVRLANVWEHVTRVDLAVTVRPDEPAASLVQQAKAEYVNWQPARGRKPDWRTVSDSRGGNTLYVGERTGDWFLRVYDKGAESRDARYLGSTRYELECKGTPVRDLAARLAGAPDRPSLCQRAVHQYLTEHGIQPPFGADGNRVLSPGLRRRSDADSRLDWVRRQVRPSIEWLVAKGYGPRLREMLDLADPADVAPPTSPPG